MDKKKKTEEKKNTIKKTYRYRIYPNDEQIQFLNQSFGNCRKVYNMILNIKYDTYQNEKKYISKQDAQDMIPDMKIIYDYLKKTPSQALQDSTYRVTQAFEDFYSPKNLRIRKKKNIIRINQGHKPIIKPSYRSKKKKQSITIPNNVKLNSIYLDKENKLLKIPKLKSLIKVEYHREHIGIIKTIVIKKTTTNNYYVSLHCEKLVEEEKNKEIKENTTVGIDVGLLHYAVLSDGTKYENPRNIEKSHNLIKRRNRQLKRKQFESKNREKMRLKLSRTYEKLTNRRNDFLQKLSYSITKKYDTICVEDLNISDMLKNKYLSRSISDAAWGMFSKMLEYKCKWLGKNFIKIDKWIASSKTCSHCKYINKNLKLHQRTWICPECGSEHDRDLNASINIKYEGLLSVGWVPPEFMPVDTLIKYQVGI